MKLPKNKLLIPAIIIVGGVAIAGFLLIRHGKGTSTALAADQAAYAKIPTDAGKANYMQQSSGLAKPVDPELVNLDSQIISCAPNVDGLLGSNPTTGGSCTSGPTTLATTTGLYMGGQCCGVLMNTDAYHAELQKLQAYKDTPNIPLDPMRTPVAMAKYWIDYDNSTTLNSAQQTVMDQAMAMSKEKPCCCKCWHYFTNEGIAKQMIINGTWNAEKIAAFWDASDICG